MSDKPKAKHLRVVKTDGEHEQIVQQEDPKPVYLDVVEALEALVQRAKAGEVIGCAFALQLTDEYVSTDYVGDILSYQTLGLFDELKIKILSDMQEDE